MAETLRKALKAYIRELSAESKSGLTENLERYAQDQLKILRKMLRDHPDTTTRR